MVFEVFCDITPSCPARDLNGPKDRRNITQRIAGEVEP